MAEINPIIEKAPEQAPGPEQIGGEKKEKPVSPEAALQPDRKQSWKAPQISGGQAPGAENLPPGLEEVSIKEIERALSNDLENLYFKMTPAQQIEFKAKGEEAARNIQILLQEVKIKVKKITNLIINWLKLIPGVNKYFLEQESKIKTDDILKLR